MTLYRFWPGLIALLLSAAVGAACPQSEVGSGGDPEPDVQAEEQAIQPFFADEDELKTVHWDDVRVVRFKLWLKRATGKRVVIDPEAGRRSISLHIWVPEVTSEIALLVLDAMRAEGLGVRETEVGLWITPSPIPQRQLQLAMNAVTRVRGLEFLEVPKVVLVKSLPMRFPFPNAPWREQAFACLGISQNGEAECENIFGSMYDPETRTIRLPESRFDPAEPLFELLVYQFAFALLDQHFNLSHLYDQIDDFERDREFAQRCLIDGEALLILEMALEEPLDTQKIPDPGWRTEYWCSPDVQIKVYGLRYVRSAYGYGGWDEVDRKRQDLPPTLEILANEWSAGSGAAAPLHLPVLADEGELLFDVGHGPYYHSLIMREMAISDARADRVVKTWRADRWHVYRFEDEGKSKSEGEFVSVLVTVLDSPESAEFLIAVFDTSIRGGRGGGRDFPSESRDRYNYRVPYGEYPFLSVEVDGPRVILVRGSSHARVHELREAAVLACRQLDL